MSGIGAFMFGGGDGLNLTFSTAVGHAVVSPANATATINFLTTGGCSFAPSGSGGWYDGTPSGWSIRRTINSGALQLDAGVGWLALSSNRQFGCQETGIGTRTANVTFDFSSDGGTTIHGTRSVVFTATVEP